MPGHIAPAETQLLVAVATRRALRKQAVCG
jgi:hypothetical protein